MVAIDEADGLGFRAALEHLRAAEFQVLDENNAIAVGEDIAMGIFDDARAGGGFGFGGALPFVAARDTFELFSMRKDFRHFAHRANRLTHKGSA